MQDQISSDGYYGAPELSVRNVEEEVLCRQLRPTYTPGTGTEDYEVKKYSISLNQETKKKECVAVRGLLNHDDVVF